MQVSRSVLAATATVVLALTVAGPAYAAVNSSALSLPIALPADPSAPGSPDPSAPDSPDPSAPDSPDPSAPDSPDPSAPDSPDPSAPDSPEPSAPGSSEPSVSPSTKLSSSPADSLAAAGAGNREIAQALFVTQRTVELHLTNAYRKLRITTRTQLATALADLEPKD